MGKTAGSGAVIRPSKRIIYDTKEAVVSFLSENVNTCVDEFLEEWARVSKMVVIAREGSVLAPMPIQSPDLFSVAQMSKHRKWQDVRLLSFDLQTVEFAYAGVSSLLRMIRVSFDERFFPPGLHSLNLMRRPAIFNRG